AVVGSALPEILSKNGFSMTAGKDGVADNIKYAFYIGAVVFMIAILITVFFTKEYSPSEYERYHGKISEEEKKAGLSEIFS
ncbi:hypothetical protein ABTN46_19715, partial [Acinetobacter baumannii]